MPDEVNFSLLARAAARNGRELAQFVTDLGINLRGFVYGELDALRYVADLTGAPLEQLRDQCFCRTDATFAFRGLTFPRSALQRANLRVCPACVRADIEAGVHPEPAAPYIRTSWVVAAVRRCDLHGLALVELPRSQPHGPRWFDFLPDLRASLDDLPWMPRAATAFDAYLSMHLSGGEPVVCDPWTAALEPHVVARIAQTMGAVLRHGRKPGLKHLTNEDLHQSSALGYQYLARGPEGLTDYLQGLYDSYPMGRRSTAEAQAVLGSLHELLARGAPEPEFDPVRDVVRRFILERFDLGPGNTALGIAVEQRVVHSLRSASVQWDIHPKRLRKLCAAAGLITPDQADVVDGRILMPADQVDAIVQTDLTSLNLTDLERALAVPRPQPTLLRDAGMIKPIPWSVQSAGTLERYAKADIEAFLDRLASGATPGEPPEDAVDPITAARRTCTSLVAVLTAILDKKLRVWKDPEVSGVIGLSVLVEDVRGALHVGELPGMPLIAAERHLRTHHKALGALVKAKVFSMVEAKHPVHGGTVEVIPPELIQAFEREYIGLQRIADARKVRFSRVINELKRMGIHPVWDPKVMHAYWYRRSSIPIEWVAG